jgi:hypothetical protein
MTVTLQTNCWERDWREVLATDRLRIMGERNDFPFARKTLLINSKDHLSQIIPLARSAVGKGWITDFTVVEEHADDALRFFGLTRAELGRAYGYSISEWVGIYLCDSDYLLYYMGDCLPARRQAWIPAALGVFAARPEVRVANLLWNGKTDEARAESSDQTEDFFLGCGFSDQCYLVRAADFRQRIYGYSHPASARYPAYAGESFEKRIDSWMHCHSFLRATYKHASYEHRHVPPPRKNQMQKLASLVRGMVGRRIN